MQVLLFTVESRRCAIPLSNVAEVVPAVNVEAVPDAPSMVEGVVNVRGEILPVLSLRARLGFPRKSVDASEYFILVHTNARRVIVRSDSPPEITTLTLPDEAAPGAESVERVLTGVIPLPDGLALLQDVEAIMSGMADVIFSPPDVVVEASE